MEPITFGLGLALSIAGGFMKTQAAREQQQAQEQLIAVQQRQEGIREQALTLDAQRRRRQAIRQSMIQRAQALTTATSQGASQGSALGGSYGQIAGELNFAMEGINQQEAFGHQMFSANRDALVARRAMAASETQSTTGSGLSSLGGTLISNLGPISRMGGNLTGLVNNG